MTRGRVLAGAGVGVVAYVVALVGGGGVAAAVAASTREVPPTGWLLLVPAVLAGLVAPLVARAGRSARPVAGLLVAAPAAAVAGALTAWGNALAEAHGGPPASERLLDVVVQPVLVLAAAAATVLVLRRRDDRQDVPAAD